MYVVQVLLPPGGNNLITSQAIHWPRNVIVPTPAFSALTLSATRTHLLDCILLTLHEPLTCIVEVQESVPSGFEVSSREKEGTCVISLSNYFHYKKIPIFIFPLFEMALRKHMPDCYEQSCTFQTLARTKYRKAWFVHDVYKFLSHFLSPPPWASAQKWYMLNTFHITTASKEC